MWPYLCPLLFLSAICYHSTFASGLDDHGVKNPIRPATAALQQALLTAAAQRNTAFPARSSISTLLEQYIRRYAPDYPYAGPRVRKALAAAAAAVNLPNPDNDVCERDYSALCPMHWLSIGDGSTCVAGQSYKGSCGPDADFTNFTPLQKYTFGVTCNVEWPCVTPCVEDHAAPCPVHFDVQDDGSCVATPTYHGPCIRAVSFQRLLPAYRKIWGEICSVRWPCRTPCQRNPKLPCPQGWTLSQSQQVCVAPYSYLGPCSPVQPVSMPQEDMITKCRVAYDCAPRINKEKVDGVECERDYDKSQCPAGWTLTGTDRPLCIAKTSYKGRCPWRFSPNGYNATMKAAFAKACNAPWVCKLSVEHPQVTVDNYFPDGNMESSKLQSTMLFLNVSGPYSEANRVFVPAVLNQTNDENEFSAKPAESMANTRASSLAVVKKHQQLLDDFLSLARPQLPLTVVNAISESQQQLKNRPHDVVFDYRFRMGEPFLPNKHSKLIERFRSGPSTTFRFRARENLYPGIRHTSLTNVTEKPSSVFPVPHIQDKTIVGGEQAVSELEEYHKARNMSYPDLKENGLYHLTRSGKNSEYPADSQSLMERIQFPRIAYVDRKRLTLIDNLNARLDAYGRDSRFSDDTIDVTDSHCIRDYAKPCPLRWQPLVTPKTKNISNVTLCMAESTYQDELRCGSVQPFGAMTQQEKEQAELMCKVAWPCRHCYHDYIRSVCPQGWIHEGKGVCRKSRWLKQDEQNERRQSTGNWCPDVLNFGYMPPQLRRVWAATCGYDWPCFQECERDFSFGCPRHWGPIERTLPSNASSLLCAPFNPNQISSIGRCGVLLEVPFDISERYRLESTCGVRWPCRELCRMDFWQTCPYGFTYDPGANECVAPTESIDGTSIQQIPYHGACPTRQRFSSSFTKVYKKQYAERCHAPWPCKGTCDQDFSHACPRRWNKKKPAKGGILCTPNLTYKGPCKSSSYNLTNFDFPAKWEFAWRCQVRWPCGGYSFSGRFRTMFSDKKWMVLEKREETAQGTTTESSKPGLRNFTLV